MGSFEKQRQDELRQKFKIDSLQYERKQALPNLVEQKTQNAGHYQRYLDGLREKWNIGQGLELDGIAKREVTTLEDLSRERAKKEQEQEGKLCVANMPKAWRGVSRLWFSVKS